MPTSSSSSSSSSSSASSPPSSASSTAASAAASPPDSGLRNVLWSVLCFALCGAAFGVAEVSTAAAPSEAEPARVLLLAILAMTAVGAVAGVLHGLAVSALADVARRRPGIDRVIGARGAAFAVPGVLLLPKLRIAIGYEPVLALAVAAAGLLALGLLLWRMGSDGLASRGLASRGLASRDLAARAGAYGLVALGLWPLFLRIKDLASVAELRSSMVVLGWLPWGVLAASGLALAWVAAPFSSARADPRADPAAEAGPNPRRAAPGPRWALLAVGGLFAAVVVWRLLAPPAWDLGLEPAEERLGRGTPVVLIVLDTTRADHLSVYGYPRETSPALDALAADSVVWEHAVSTSSWTLPAHASLFTGLFPLTHGALRLPGLDDDAAALSERDIHRPAYPLAEDFRTLAEWFVDSDHATGAVVANFAYLAPAFRISQGFETYFAVRNVPVEPRILRVVDRRVVRLPGLARHWQVYRSAEQINEQAVRWLEAQSTNRFFLFLNYMEAHLPWGPHQPGLRYEEFAAEPRLPAPPRGEAPDEDRWRRRVDLYDSNIASMDAELGRLFERLKAMELYDRSLIIVTADHGESFGENGFDGHGKSLNESEVWVPLIVKHPYSREAGRRAETVQLVDVLPTILRELGRAAGNGESRAERPAEGARELEFGQEIEGEPLGQVGHPILAEMYTDPREGDDVFHGYRAALWEGDRKLVVRSDGERRLFAGPRLDRVVDDGGEIASGEIASGEIEEGEILSWMDGRTDGLLERWGLLEARAKERQSAAEIDPELKAGLEALGYL